MILLDIPVVLETPQYRSLPRCNTYHPANCHLWTNLQLKVGGIQTGILERLVKLENGSDEKGAPATLLFSGRVGKLWKEGFQSEEAELMEPCQRPVLVYKQESEVGFVYVTPAAMGFGYEVVVAFDCRWDKGGNMKVATVGWLVVAVVIVVASDAVVFCPCLSLCL